MRRFKFADINFYEIEFKELTKFFLKKNLFVFPSAPGLATIDVDKQYHKSLVSSDIAFLDSGFFVILIFIRTGRWFKKFSGLNFINHLLSFLITSKASSLFIEASASQAKKNKKYLNHIGLENNLSQYIAPIYSRKSNFIDNELLKFINKIKPKFIIINLGGGTQENLGFFLKGKINYNVNIFCLGAAIGFRSGNQAPAPVFLDDFFLSWFIRCLFNPALYIPRYFKAFRLFKTFFKYKIEFFDH